jgi:hypothetical protein
LAETIFHVTQCDSSGLSLLTKDDGRKRFYWPAITSAWKPQTGGGTPFSAVAEPDGGEQHGKYLENREKRGDHTVRVETS